MSVSNASVLQCVSPLFFLFLRNSSFTGDSISLLNHISYETAFQSDHHPVAWYGESNDDALRQWFSTICHFSRGATASDKNIHNYLQILYFVYGTTFCRSQNNRITWRRWQPTFFIKNCFKCDYDHYTVAAFGNAWTTLWRKNVLCLQIRYLNAVSNLEVILVCNELCCGVICIRRRGLSHWCCHVHEFNKWVIV